MKSAQLEQMFNQGLIWRTKEASPDGQVTGDNTYSTGIAVLDKALSQGGWPKSGTVEVLSDQFGIGEVEVFVPLIRQICQSDTGAIGMINSPFIPYPPGWLNHDLSPEKIVMMQGGSTSDHLWITQQALQSGAFKLVILFTTTANFHIADLKKLNRTAQIDKSLLLHFRPKKSAIHPSPAPIRIMLEAGKNVGLRILKQRGAARQSLLEISRNPIFYSSTPDINHWPCIGSEKSTSIGLHQEAIDHSSKGKISSNENKVINEKIVINHVPTKLKLTISDIPKVQ